MKLHSTVGATVCKHVGGWRILGVAFLVVAVLAFGSVANATTFNLPPGATVSPTSSTVPVSATLLASSPAVAFSSGLYSGTLSSAVYKNDPDNALGGLTFTYQISNLAASVDPIERLTINSFGATSVDAFYVAATGLVPTLFDRSTGTVGASFIAAPVGPGKLSPGITSALLVLHTDATDFTATTASVIDGTVSSVASFAPFSASVPEPSTIALLAIGAIGVPIYRRRLF